MSELVEDKETLMEERRRTSPPARQRCTSTWKEGTSTRWSGSSWNGAASASTRTNKCRRAWSAASWRRAASPLGRQHPALEVRRHPGPQDPGRDGAGRAAHLQVLQLHAGLAYQPAGPAGLALLPDLHPPDAQRTGPPPPGLHHPHRPGQTGPAARRAHGCLHLRGQARRRQARGGRGHLRPEHGTYRAQPGPGDLLDRLHRRAEIREEMEEAPGHRVPLPVRRGHRPRVSGGQAERDGPLASCRRSTGTRTGRRRRCTDKGEGCEMSYLTWKERLRIPTYDNPSYATSGKVAIDEEKCNGCGDCVMICPGSALYLAGVGKHKRPT